MNGAKGCSHCPVYEIARSLPVEFLYIEAEYNFLLAFSGDLTWAKSSQRNGKMTDFEIRAICE